MKTDVGYLLSCCHLDVDPDNEKKISYFWKQILIVNFKLQRTESMSSSMDIGWNVEGLIIEGWRGQRGGSTEC